MSDGAPKPTAREFEMLCEKLDRLDRKNDRSHRLLHTKLDAVQRDQGKDRERLVAIEASLKVVPELRSDVRALEERGGRNREGRRGAQGPSRRFGCDRGCIRDGRRGDRSRRSSRAAADGRRRPLAVVQWLLSGARAGPATSPIHARRDAR